MFRLGGKAGVGIGGAKKGFYYSPIEGKKDVKLQFQPEISLGQTEFYGGAGVSGDYEGTLWGSLPSLPSLPSFPSLPSLPSPPSVVSFSPAAPPATIVGDSWLEPLPGAVQEATPVFVAPPVFDSASVSGSWLEAATAPARKPFIEVASGVSLGKLHANSQFGIGKDDVHLDNLNNNLAGIAGGVKVGPLSIGNQAGLGYGASSSLPASAPAKKPFISIEHGVHIGKLHAGGQLGVGNQVQLNDNDNNLAGLAGGVKVGPISIGNQAGIGYSG